MVGEPVDIEILSFIWDYRPGGNVDHLARHDVTTEDVVAVRAGKPLFFHNLPGRAASHVMIGRDGRGRSLYVALLAAADPGVWIPITGWQSALAHGLLEEDGQI